MNGKKIIFISHIAEEKELAEILSTEIQKSYLGMLDTFVSSEGASIPAGTRWLESIDDALSNSAVQISLCSPQSIQRPWINFEAGASWIRRVPVIPLCHSGLQKGHLPIPLALLQAADINDNEDIQRMFKSLTSTLGATHNPEIDYNYFIKKCGVFVEKYSYFEKIKQAIFAIINTEPQLKQIFIEKTCKSMPINLQDWKLFQINSALEELKKESLISYAFNRQSITGQGIFRSGHITLTEKYINDIQDRI